MCEMKKAGWFSILVAVVAACCCSHSRGAAAEKSLPHGNPGSEPLLPVVPVPREALRLALRELGYIEGQNIAIEYRFAERKSDRPPELAADLVRLKVDIIVVAGGTGLAAKNATKTIPIVMVGTGDPVGLGLVESLARPGGNVTGLTNFTPELNGKRLELLKEAVPKLARVGVLWRPVLTLGILEVKELRLAGAERELKLEYSASGTTTLRTISRGYFKPR